MHPKKARRVNHTSSSLPLPPLQSLPLPQPAPNRHLFQSHSNPNLRKAASTTSDCGSSPRLRQRSGSSSNVPPPDRIGLGISTYSSIVLDFEQDKAIPPPVPPKPRKYIPKPRKKGPSQSSSTTTTAADTRRPLPTSSSNSNKGLSKDNGPVLKLHHHNPSLLPVPPRSSRRDYGNSTDTDKFNLDLTSDPALRHHVFRLRQEEEEFLRHHKLGLVMMMNEEHVSKSGGAVDDAVKAFIDEDLSLLDNYGNDTPTLFNTFYEPTSMSTTHSDSINLTPTSSRASMTTNSTNVTDSATVNSPSSLHTPKGSDASVGSPMRTPASSQASPARAPSSHSVGFAGRFKNRFGRHKNGDPGAVEKNRSTSGASTKASTSTSSFRSASSTLQAKSK